MYRWSMLVAAAACGRVGFSDGIDAATGPHVDEPATAMFATRCGAAMPDTNPIQIANDGTADLVITGADATGGFTVVTALPLTIAPQASATLDVRPPLAVIGTDRAGDQKTGTLTIATNAAQAAAPIQLAATVIGAQLALTDLLGGTPTLALAGSGGACPAGEALRLSNTGTSVVTVHVDGTDGFAISAISGWSGGIGPVAAGGSVTFTVDASTGGPCSGFGSVSYAVVSGDTCSESPVVLEASFAISGSSSCACS